MSYQVFPTLDQIAQKNVVWANGSLSIRAAAELMHRHQVSSVLVECDGEKCIFSSEHFLEFLHAGRDCDILLQEIRLKRLACLPGAERVLGALEYLERSGDRYLGVLGMGSELLGIVTYSDILTSIDPVVLMERKTVGDILDRTAPVTYTADWILEDVVHHLKKPEDAILVIEDGRAIGIITVKNIFESLALHQSLDQPLSNYMTSPVITTHRNYPISKALFQLQEHNIKRAIVVDDDNRVIGVVTQSELVGYAYGTWANILKNHTSELHELVDILKEKMRHLEVLTSTDVLTGLGNRRMLDQRFVEETSRIRRHNTASFSLAIVDIDDFKQINDRYGHLIGDEILKSLADELTELVRKNDTAVRWGGEEFAVLLPNTGLTSAIEFAQRFRTLIEQKNFVKEIRLTVSVGVGEFVRDEDEKAFFKRVDAALYRAKSNGKNCVETG